MLWIKNVKVFKFLVQLPDSPFKNANLKGNTSPRYVLMTHIALILSGNIVNVFVVIYEIMLLGF